MCRRRALTGAGARGAGAISGGYLTSDEMPPFGDRFERHLSPLAPRSRQASGRNFRTLAGPRELQQSRGPGLIGVLALALPLLAKGEPEWPASGHAYLGLSF